MAFVDAVLEAGTMGIFARALTNDRNNEASRRNLRLMQQKTGLFFDFKVERRRVEFTLGILPLPQRKKLKGLSAALFCHTLFCTPFAHSSRTIEGKFSVHCYYVAVSQCGIHRMARVYPATQ